MSNKLTILFDKIRWEEKALYESARKKNIHVTNVNCNNLFIDLNNEITEDYGVVLQRCVSYFRSLHSTAALEGKGVNVVNPLHTSIVAGNKLFSHMKLKEANITTPKSIVAFSKDSALAALDKLEYPSVLKPTVGSWGRLVALLNDREAAESVIEDREYMFPLYQIYYLEEFVKRPPRDIRSIVVGDNVVGAIYRYSPEGRWKTNMSLGGKAELCPLTKDLEDICLRAARAVGGEIVGVDLMEDDRKGLLVHEVNNTTEFKNVTRVTGNDIPSIIIDYTMSSKR
ncbi:MAG: lysine biosynthesis protein LysX [Thaumarchaeota archaeon]|nr:lysine biosynthesis protein LysX [Nitrososphaerota archaeon]